MYLLLVCGVLVPRFRLLSKSWLCQPSDGQVVDERHPARVRLSRAFDRSEEIPMSFDECAGVSADLSTRIS